MAHTDQSTRLCLHWQNKCEREQYFSLCFKVESDDIPCLRSALIASWTFYTYLYLTVEMPQAKQIKDTDPLNCDFGVKR